MILYNISNTERFFERILTCQGNVYSVDSDKQPQDLKRTAEYLLSSGMARHMDGIDRINRRVERPTAAASIMRLMAELNLDRRTHAAPGIA